MTTKGSSPEAAWKHMTEISEESPVRNFTQTLDMTNYVVETDLFPLDVLNAYSAWNLEHELTDAQSEHFDLSLIHI